MGCLHSSTCPLFPHLNESLAGWRSYYCDHQANWRECARYQVALTGERVPITLLPNGRHARYLAPTPEQPRTPAQGPTPAQEPERGWWARLAEWMKGNA
ncbi:hypothetical protein IAG44_20660 [Streptomyces roseirectus]|uniref:Uncharacterized protein n=1 Tax=Streptomyces roseirectus TaxID=2768066 RepID=A0A7H0ISV9_9ACTN|nr:hypothetical protein IAG44_20660 [Streptomyces roseirectus]